MNQHLKNEMLILINWFNCLLLIGSIALLLEFLMDYFRGLLFKDLFVRVDDRSFFESAF